jgi:hypothetical protein
VSLVFVEKVGDDAKWSTERGLIEALFASAFKDSCFTLMEAGVKVTEVSANGDLNQETIDAIVKNSNAQYVVLGSGRIMMREKSALVDGSKMNSYGVSANLKLVNTSTNEIEAVAAKSSTVMAVSPEAALRIANNSNNAMVAGVMDEIVKKVAQRWTSDLVNAGRVQVIVQQVPNIAAAKAFKELMARVAVGSRVDMRDVKGGLATFDVDVPGGAEALSALVEGKQAGKLTVEVVEMSRGKMVVRLK